MRSSRPRRLRIPVRASVDGALPLAAKSEGGVERRGRMSGEHGRRVETLGTDSASAAADERADVLTVRTQRKPDDGHAASCRAGRGRRRADGPGPGRRGCERCRAPRRSEATPPRSETHDASSTGRADLVPHPDLARLEPEDAGERRGRERRDLVRVAQAAEVDEEPRERGQVEPARRSEGRGLRRERCGERAEELQLASGSGRSESRLRTPTVTRSTRSGTVASEATAGSTSR